MSTYREESDGYWIERPPIEDPYLSKDDYATDWMWCAHCDRRVREGDDAPSCGAHRLHIDCAHQFSCVGCRRVRTEDVTP